LEVMRELGMLDDLLKLPHQEVRAFSAQAYGELVPIADFSFLPTHCKFIAFMPQWDFLDFLAAKAARYPSFHLRKRAEVVGLAKGTIDEIRRKGLDAFRESIARIVPYARDRVGELRSWDDASLLTVRVDRLVRWYRPGLLCIGDAAHAMSPVGGIGINLALQDAVAAANLLAGPLAERRVAVADLDRVPGRREPPARVIQPFAVLGHERCI